MRIKQLLTKTLLAAAGLCMGGNVWAAVGDETTVVNIDFTGATLTDGAGTVTGTPGSMVVATSNSSSAMRIGDGSTVKFSRSGTEYIVPAGILVVGTGTGTVNIAEADRVGYGKAENKDQVKITFGMTFGNASGCRNGFTIKDSEGETVAAMSYGWWPGFGDNTFSLESSNLHQRTAGTLPSYLAVWDNATTFTLIFDYKTSKMSIQTDVMSDPKTIAMPTTKPIAQFIVSGSYGTNADRSGLFDNLVIKNIEGDYTTESADYKVNWVYSGSIIKTDTRSGDVGTNPEITSTDKEAFILGENKYLYVSDNADAVTIAKDNSTVVTITLDVADKYAYAVNAVEQGNTSNVLKVITSSSYFPDEKVYYSWPRYINVDGTLWEQQKSTWGGAGLSSSFTLDENDKKLTVEYKETSITGISFLVEGEDIVGANVLSSGNINARASGAKAAYSASALDMTTLPAGVYSMFIDLASPTRPNNYTFGGAGVFIASSEFSKSNHVTFTRDFTLPTETTITFKGGDGDDGLDYLYITKTADLPATVTVADNGIGYATFSSDYNLNFEGSAVKAYVATEAAAGTVKFEQVTTVPAKTGLFLKGNGEVNITTEAVAAPTTNYLKPTTGAIVAASDAVNNVYHYVFAKQDEDLGFYNLGEDLTMTAGKAYLETAASIAPAGARVALVFDDETTGISSIESVNQANGNVFNLNGQRVVKPAKGLYIVNGKKFINK